ncbi:SCO2525 family SAM-dependent methyltransferase [Actinoallomurus liliacearum]|uniref:SCO2525 family SAM-dependent methyltransferase n=1 Tax=Actinoallomurus liliacearum TaxID=1080073 RepID=A0ABP8TX84_9ACTN
MQTATGALDPGARGNGAFDWGRFNARVYWGDNFSSLRGDDREMLERGVRWFDASTGGQLLHGVDGGAGASVGLALAQLPFCRRLTLLDFSPDVVDYLRAQVRRLGEEWEPFWEVVRPIVEHRIGDRDFAWARTRLNKIAKVRHGSILTDLPAGHFDLGTMGFVAESISEQHSEFDKANEMFLRALKPGAPFFAEYMENSQGYVVDGIRWPATSVGVDDVRAALTERATKLRVDRLDPDPKPLRPGYTGYVVATGIRDHGPRPAAACTVRNAASSRVPHRR